MTALRGLHSRPVLPGSHAAPLNPPRAPCLLLWPAGPRQEERLICNKVKGPPLAQAEQRLPRGLPSPYHLRGRYCEHPEHPGSLVNS